MRLVAGEVHWEVRELMGTYAVCKLEGEEAREAEQLILEGSVYLYLAESYAEMLVVLSALSKESL